jgi:hypothetical protein
MIQPIRTHWPASLLRGLFASTFAAAALSVWAAAPPVPQGFITARGYLDIGSGTAVANLTGNPKFPASPDVVYYYPYFEWNATGDITVAANNAYGVNYGVQIVGYFYPPTSGDYIFWLCSDDNGDLYLSPTDNPADKKLIARENGWSGPRNWELVGGGGSLVEAKNSSTFTNTAWPVRDSVYGGARITLTKGQAYYIEALMKQGTGGNNLAVAVAAPDGSIDQSLPIPGEHLSTIDKTTGSIRIVISPQSQTVNEGASVTFRVEADGSLPYAYQWKKNNLDIPDATNATYTISQAHHSDNGARYQVVVTGAVGTITSAEAILTVLSDTTPPGVTLASTSLGNTVKIQFTEWIDPVTATNPANYVIAGETVTSALLDTAGNVVTLAVSPRITGNVGVLISNIRDFAGNVIPANTGANILVLGVSPGMIVYWPLDTAVGTKTPDIVSGYDLNLQNLTTNDLVPGKAGKAFKFDIAKSTILWRENNPAQESLPVIQKNPSFTVSMWVNGPPNQPDRRVWSEAYAPSTSDANAPLFVFGTDQNGNTGLCDVMERTDAPRENDTHYRTVATVFDNTWHHICLVQSSNAAGLTANFYVDGVLDPMTGAGNGPIVAKNRLTAARTALGGIMRGSGQAYFTGLIDDVAVWNRALDPEEVLELTLNGTPTPVPIPQPLAIRTFSSDLPAVAKGGTVLLRWDVSKDADKVSIEPNIGDVTARTTAGAGSIGVTLAESVTYTLKIQRGVESLTQPLAVAAIDGVSPGWTLLDNFDRYAAGALPAPWEGPGGCAVADVSGNRVLSVNGGGSLVALPLNLLSIPEGQKTTLFTRFFLVEAAPAAGIDAVMGLTDKGIRLLSDFVAGGVSDVGPDALFQNPDGDLQMGIQNLYQSPTTLAADKFQPGTVYNLWLDLTNDTIANADLVSIYVARDGTTERTLLFSEVRSDRNPEDTSFLGPTRPTLIHLVVGAVTANTKLYFDDFYLSSAGYSSTVPRAFGFTTPIPEVPASKPTLKATLSGPNILLSWSASLGAGFTLKSAQNLVPPVAWIAVARPVVETGGTNFVTIPVSQAQEFYRLVK